LHGWALGWGGGQPPSSEPGQPHGVKAAGLKGSGLPARLKEGGFVHANIDIFVFLVTILWIYQLNHWMGFVGDCGDVGVLGAPSVPGIRAS